jgi:hypothetical protein
LSYIKVKDFDKNQKKMNSFWFSSILRTTDTTKQKLLLRALKRLISGDKRSLDVARSNTNNELAQTLQQLKKSAA